MNSALDHFISTMEQHWAPVNSQLTLLCKTQLEKLCKECVNEPWIVNAVEQAKPETEIYRSQKHGFILQAHVEHKGDVSPPHNHGNGWVLYATVKGRVQMGIFHEIIQPEGQLIAVQKDRYDLTAGQCSVYMPGDIHDTTTLEDNTLMLRLTSCDFHREFAQGRLVRFMHNHQAW